MNIMIGKTTKMILDQMCEKSGINRSRYIERLIIAESIDLRRAEEALSMADDENPDWSEDFMDQD